MADAASTARDVSRFFTDPKTAKALKSRPGYAQQATLNNQINQFFSAMPEGVSKPASNQNSIASISKALGREFRTIEAPIRSLNKNIGSLAQIQRAGSLVNTRLLKTAEMQNVVTGTGFKATVTTLKTDLANPLARIVTFTRQNTYRDRELENKQLKPWRRDMKNNTTLSTGYLKKLADPNKGLFRTILGYLGHAGAGIISGAAILGATAVGALFKGLVSGRIFKSAVAGIKNTIGFLVGFGGAAGRVISAYGGVASIMKFVGKTFLFVDGILSVFKGIDTFMKTGDVQEALASSLDAFTLGITKWISKQFGFEDTKAMLESIDKDLGISDKIQVIKRNISAFINDPLTYVDNIYKDASAELDDFFNGTNGSTPGYRKVIAGISAFADKSINFITQVFDSQIEAFNNFFTKNVNYYDPVSGNLSTSTQFEHFQKEIAKTIGKGIGDFLTATEKQLSNINISTDSVKSFFSDVSDRIFNFTSKATSAIVGFIGDIFTNEQAVQANVDPADKDSLLWSVTKGAFHVAGAAVNGILTGIFGDIDWGKTARDFGEQLKVLAPLTFLKMPFKLMNAKDIVSGIEMLQNNVFFPIRDFFGEGGKLAKFIENMEKSIYGMRSIGPGIIKSFDGTRIVAQVDRTFAPFRWVIDFMTSIVGAVESVAGIGKLIAGASRIVGKIAWPLQIAMSVYDFFDGFLNASDKLGIDESKLGLGDKITSGIASIVDGFFTFPVNALLWMYNNTFGVLFGRVNSIDNIGQVFGFENTNKALQEYFGNKGGGTDVFDMLINGIYKVPFAIGRWVIKTLTGLDINPDGLSPAQLADQFYTKIGSMLGLGEGGLLRGIFGWTEELMDPKTDKVYIMHHESLLIKNIKDLFGAMGDAIIEAKDYVVQRAGIMLGIIEDPAKKAATARAAQMDPVSRMQEVTRMREQMRSENTGVLGLGFGQSFWQNNIEEYVDKVAPYFGGGVDGRNRARLFLMGNDPAPFLGDTPHAKGGAFNKGVKLFAAGGTISGRGSVIDSPTAFTYNGGQNTGVAGEAGTEIIAPAKRMPDGNVGIQAMIGLGKAALVGIGQAGADALDETINNMKSSNIFNKMLAAINRLGYMMIGSTGGVFGSSVPSTSFGGSSSTDITQSVAPPISGGTGFGGLLGSAGTDIFSLPNVVGNKGAAASTGGGSAAETAFRFFVSKGYSEAQSAGIVGNLIAESGMRTDAVGDNGTSFGIAQWHNERWQGGRGRMGLRQFASSHGKPETDLNTQLEYLFWELQNSEKSANGMVLNSSTPGQAAEAFMRGFERPKTMASLPSRIANAQKLAGGDFSFKGTAGGGGGYGSTMSSLGSDIASGASNLFDSFANSFIDATPENVAQLRTLLTNEYNRVVSSPALAGMRGELSGGVSALQSQLSSAASGVRINPYRASKARVEGAISDPYRDVTGPISAGLDNLRGGFDRGISGVQNAVSEMGNRVAGAMSPMEGRPGVNEIPVVHNEMGLVLFNGPGL